MWTVFRYRFAQFRGSIIGWGLGVAALGAILIPFYDVFQRDQAALTTLIESYPPEFMAFFGGMADFAKPEGYLDSYLSFMPVILGIFTVLAGSGLIVADEESGRLDLILSYPVSRTTLFAGRLLALIAALVATLIVGWLGFTIPLYWSPMDVTWGEMALPFVSMLAVTLVFGALALLLSMVLPARRSAAAVAGLLLVASYFLTSLSNINPDLSAVAQLLPFDYYQGGSAINGLNLAWLFGLLATSTVLLLLAWWRFSRRDIRVGGEGGWAVSLRGRHTLTRVRPASRP